MSGPGPSLEGLVEGGLLQLDVLHPGGLATSEELAAMCGIGRGTIVLDVASGTGATARHLAEALGAEVVGVDRSPRMIERAHGRAGGLARFVRGDAHRLPFRAAAFDVAISECTLSLLDKTMALEEMARVVRAGGRVAAHEICWTPGAPERLRRRLFELERERPETLAGWKRLFEAAGLRDVRAVDRSELVPRWMRESRSALGLRGQLRAAGVTLRRWGPSGLFRLLASERLFRSPYLGYAMLVGVRP